VVFCQTGILSQSNVFSITNQCFLSEEWEMKLRKQMGGGEGWSAGAVLLERMIFIH
jgi:hypothetical protein